MSHSHTASRKGNLRKHCCQLFYIVFIGQKASVHFLPSVAMLTVPRSKLLNLADSIRVWFIDRQTESTALKGDGNPLCQRKTINYVGIRGR